MKKILILITLFMLFISQAMAEVTETKYCAVPEKKDTGSKLSKVISNITGGNFLSTKAAETAIQNVIKNQLGSNVNIEIYPYTVGSLLQGKFKKMSITAKSLNLTGLYVSNFNAETLCEYNQVNVKDGELLFKENFVMGFSGKITNEDLEKTMSSPLYLQTVQSARIKLFGQDLFKLSYMKIAIKNNKLILVANVMSPVLWGTEAKKITATSSLSVENGKIKYENIRIMDTNLNKWVQTLLSLFNLVNPFTFEIKLSKNTSGYTSVKNVIIENNEIKMDGVLYIPKNN